MHEDFKRVVEPRNVNVAAAVSEMSVLDMLGFVRAHAIWLVVSLIIGGALGVAFGLNKPKQWEASAMVQVGQVGSADPNGQVGMIETVPNAVERINGMIKQGVGKSAPQLSAADGAWMGSTFSAQAVTGTSFLRMTVRGVSADAAKAEMLVARDSLIETHAKMMAPAQTRLHAVLASVVADNAAIDKRREVLLAQMQASVGKSASVQDLMLSTLIDKLDVEQRELLARRLALEQQVSDQQTFATRPVGDITVSGGPVAPKPSVFAVVGALIGLMVGVGLCFALGRGKAGRR